MENVIWLLVQFAILLGGSLFWYKVLNWTTEESIGMAIVTNMSFIFCTGYILGDTRSGLILSYVLAILGVIFYGMGKRFTGFRLTGQGIRKRRDFWSPSVLMLFIVFIYAVISYSNIKITNWDELNQWGKSAKFMLNNNYLPYGDSFQGEDVLLSSTTFFHYFFCKIPRTITGQINEGNLYVSNIILWFGAVLLPLSGMGWKQWKKVFVYGCVIFLSMHLLFVQPYYNIYCDQPVAMWAGALIAWILGGNRSKKTGIFVVLALANTSLMKNMVGPLFAGIVLVVMILKYYLSFDSKFLETLKCIKKELDLKNCLYGFACIISVFILNGLWSVRIRENSLIRGDGIIKNSGDRLELTVKSGLEKLFQPVNLSDSIPNITFFVFCVLCLIITFVLVRYYFKDKKTIKVYGTIFGVYIFGFCAFFCIMIYAYMTTFSYADSINTGSLNRYFSDYMMLGLIPVFGIFFFHTDEGVLQNKAGIIANGIISLLFIIVSTGTTNNFIDKVTGINLDKDSTYQERLKFLDYKAAIDDITDENGKIYMINQNKDGYFTVLADYEFGAQISRSGMCYYFTSSRINDIAGLSQYSIKSFPKDLLNNYEYLWIYKTDNYFNEKAAELFHIPIPKDGDFYRVINDNGRTRLEYTCNIKEETAENAKED